jgi:uncharacterized protein YqjF (DUF2071 family)
MLFSTGTEALQCNIDLIVTYCTIEKHNLRNWKPLRLHTYIYCKSSPGCVFFLLDTNACTVEHCTVYLAVSLFEIVQE